MKRLPLARFLSAVCATWAVAAGAVTVDCGRQAPPLRPGEARGANVLLVTIDTLRRDRVGAYGSTTHLTPALDQLAAEGFRFTHAYSHAPMTLPAHTSIMTGLTPPRHGVRNNVSFRLASNVPTIATMLKAAGYRTGAFVGAFVLDSRFGLNRGFDIYDDRNLHDVGQTSFRFAQRRAADVVDAAWRWIDSGSGAREPAPPFFCWVHVFDPHAPYEAPPEYRPGRSPYDAEVAYTDAMLGTLFDHLRSSGLMDRTLVLVTADHGESLGDHGESTHGLFAYNSTLAVPLIVHPPASGRSAGGIVDTVAAHVDVLPTIADLVGVTPPGGLDGRSLAAPAPAARAVYFEALDASLTRGWAPLTGVIQDGWKYIDLPDAELYDLSTDPDEIRNVATGQPERVRVLAQVLGGLRANASAARPADAEAAARLRSLGYVGGSTPHRGPYTSRDDPKSLVAENEEFNSALEAFNEGRAAEAAARFTALLDRRADFLTARTSAATALIALGQAPRAVQLLRAAPAEQQKTGEFLARLGTALQSAGDFRSAAEAFERAQQAGDANPDLYNGRGIAYAAMGREQDARQMFEALLAVDPEASGTWYNLGILELSHDHREAAARALEHAVESNPEYGEAWQALGAAVLKIDRVRAIGAWRKAEQLRPRDYDLLFNLGMVLADGPAPAEAVPYLERFVKEAPRDRYASDIPHVDAVLKRLQSARE